MVGRLDWLKLPWGVLAFRYAVNDHVLVIDTGPYDPKARILRWLDTFDRPPTHLLVTHVHLDHAGMAKSIADAFGCKVWCPEGERDWLASGYLHIPQPQEWWAKGMIWAQHLAKLPPVPALPGPLDGWPINLPIRKVSTPGHSPDHTSFILESEVLLPGDAIAGGRAPNSPRLSCFGEDPYDMVNSARELAGHPFSRCIPSHGGECSRESVARWAATLTSQVSR